MNKLGGKKWNPAAHFLEVKLKLLIESGDEDRHSPSNASPQYCEQHCFCLRVCVFSPRSWSWIRRTHGYDWRDWLRRQNTLFSCRQPEGSIPAPSSPLLSPQVRRAHTHTHTQTHTVVILNILTAHYNRNCFGFLLIFILQVFLSFGRAGAH